MGLSEKGGERDGSDDAGCGGMSLIGTLAGTFEASWCPTS